MNAFASAFLLVAIRQPNSQPCLLATHLISFSMTNLQFLLLWALPYKFKDSHFNESVSWHAAMIKLAQLLKSNFCNNTFYDICSTVDTFQALHPRVLISGRNWNIILDTTRCFKGRSPCRAVESRTRCPGHPRRLQLRSAASPEAPRSDWRRDDASLETGFPGPVRVHHLDRDGPVRFRRLRRWPPPGHHLHPDQVILLDCNELVCVWLSLSPIIILGPKPVHLYLLFIWNICPTYN